MSDSTPLANAFDDTAGGYDAPRRQLIPCFDRFYASVLAVLDDLIPRACRVRIIDLGAGTGLMSKMVLDHLPLASVTLVDAAQNMLDIARLRLARYSHRVTFVHADLPHYELQETCDAVVSALAIHHLNHSDKRALFARVYAALRRGGRFINADQVCGPDEETERNYRENWLRQVRESRVSEAALNAALGRMAYDIPASLADQMGWLSTVGFNEVACQFDGEMFAVYAGKKD